MRRPSPSIPSGREPHKDFLFAPSSFVQRPTSLVSMPKLTILKAGTHSLFGHDHHATILCVKGDKYSLQSESDHLFSSQHMQLYFIPIGGLGHLFVDEGQAEVMSLSFVPTSHLCASHCPEHNKTKDQYISHEDGRARRSSQTTATTLPFSTGVELWYETCKRYLTHTLVGVEIFDVKLQELFLLLRLDYSPQMLNTFLHPYHCKVDAFRAKVFALGYESISIEDLCKEFGMTQSVLKRHFMDEFGMPPQKWLAQQKGRYLYRDIIESKMSLAELAERYKFSTISYLCLFCRKHFGSTPQQIRKNIKRSPNGL